MLVWRFSIILAAAAAVSAQVKGFNYGSTNPDGSYTSQSQYQNLFTTAQGLSNAPGFTSARLYTMIAGGTTNTPTGAIQAAINTKTSLLLGMWASAGQAAFNNELAALTSAISQYGTAFTNLIVGISVGSEDLYRITPTGIANHAGVGASPTDIVNYIEQVRNAIAKTTASSKPVGHVDTWTAWVNGSNSAVVSACDFLGLDAYPYYQTTMANSIENGQSEWNDAYQATVANAQGKPIWVTETGWPLSGPTSSQAVASVANAKTYWDEVACSLLGKTNTWWYTLWDGSSSPSFGIVGSTLSTTPAFDLTCSSGTTQSSASSAAPSSPRPVSQSSVVQHEAGTSTLVHTLAQTKTPQATTLVTVTESPNQAPCSSASKPAPSAAGLSCPAALSGTWEFPHLIVPVDSSQPSKAFGTSYFGTFNKTVSSCFNFDLPASYAGKTCSLIFLFPTQDQLQTSSYTITGSGGFSITEFSAPVTESTNYSSLPSGQVIGSIDSISPGHSYVLASHECAAGSRVSFEISATGTLGLMYFQDYNPSPIGVYISVC